MAKRFTQTEKWKKDWYRELGSKWRDIWNFLLDDCNHAGIWEVSLANLAHFTGHKVTIAEIQDKFGARVLYLTDNKLFIRAFFDFQYGEAKEGFKARQSAFKELTKYGLIDENGKIRETADSVPNTSLTVTQHLPKCPEQSPDCPSTSISIGTIKSNSTSKGECEGIFSDDEWAAVYAQYPARKGNLPGKAKDALRDQLRGNREGWLRFVKSVANYAADCREVGREQQYTKHIEYFVGAKTDKEPYWHGWVEVKPDLKPRPQSKPTGPPPIKYGKSASEVMAEQERLSQKLEEQHQSTPEEIVDAKRKRDQLLGKVKGIEEAS